MVALVTIHGMGEKMPRYYAELVDALKKKIGQTRFDDTIKVAPVHYQELLQPRQDELWKKAEKLGVQKPFGRKGVLYGLGDAGAIEHAYHREYGLYLDVQKKVRSAMDVAYSSEMPERPVVVIASSLGCQVLYNFLLDADDGKGIFEKYDGVDEARARFRRLGTCRHLITTGCNIPLFVSALSEPRCFQPPNRGFQWTNLYDNDDPLGWPLSIIDSFASLVQDKEVKLPGLAAETYLSHLLYWKSDIVVDKVAGILKGLLKEAG
jgi:hypothetical protein